MLGLEAKETVIDREGHVKAKEGAFGLGILTEEPAFASAHVSIFVFEEMREKDRFRLEL